MPPTSKWLLISCLDIIWFLKPGSLFFTREMESGYFSFGLF